ncbi:2225_t:CDS:2 [Funneliformis geosporum]|uniref:2225_t:CDS:1 n=1 Tax=Funneliformis geosporum TaxID=1117311 RepID=A0A9W4SL78_9GLOM|nr:2225_t:CDS:2 [Funneliformis geosporum]
MSQNKLGKMLHQIANLTGINLSDDRKIVNHSCHRTAIQMLKDEDIPEDEIMEFSDIEDIEVKEFEYFSGNS